MALVHFDGCYLSLAIGLWRVSGVDCIADSKFVLMDPLPDSQAGTLRD